MTRKAEDAGFLDYFDDLPEPRMDGKIVHSMSELLLVTLCAMICGCEGWSDIERYGRTKLDYLRGFLPFEFGAPSDDTLRRFFRRLDPEAFQERFMTWAASLLGEEKVQQIAVDGKSVRGSNKCGERMRHLVSAFSCEGEILLGHIPTAEKSNEITAIPELLKWLDLNGALVSIDAMGCQHKIGDQIIEQGGDYLLALKENQPSLHDDVVEVFKNRPETIPMSISEISIEKGHGRIDQRQAFVITDIEWLRERHDNWKSIKSIIKIESTRIVKDKTSIENRFYISSREMSTTDANNAVRKHWFTENKNHYVLDVSFSEDSSQIAKGNAPENIAIIRRITLNLLKTMKPSMKRASYKVMRKMAGWENGFLNDILVANFVR